MRLFGLSFAIFICLLQCSPAELDIKIIEPIHDSRYYLPPDHERGNVVVRLDVDLSDQSISDLIMCLDFDEYRESCHSLEEVLMSSAAGELILTDLIPGRRSLEVLAIFTQTKHKPSPPPPPPPPPSP